MGGTLSEFFVLCHACLIVVCILLPCVHIQAEFEAPVEMPTPLTGIYLEVASLLSDLDPVRQYKRRLEEQEAERAAAAAAVGSATSEGVSAKS